MKRPTLRVLEYRHSQTHPWYLDLRPFNRGRKFFKTKAEAEAERLRQITTLNRHGREAVGLPAGELSDFIMAKSKLAEHGKTINDATDFYLDHLERVRRCKTTVAELVAELLEAKRKDGRSEIYLRDLRNRLAFFCRDFGSQLVAAVSSRELSNWLRTVNGSPKTRVNFRQNVSVLFGYAADEGMLDSNPVLRVKKPKLVDKAPEIFSVDELAALLHTALSNAPDIVPMLVIGAFAGLREAEIQRLDWSEVDLVRGFIEVKGSKAKSARRRIVQMQPNLATWLRPYSGMKSCLVPVGARRKLDRVRKAADLAHWPTNGLRHSFASYRLGACHDAPRVAAELGHTSPQMLYSTYREWVLPEEAQRYWQIIPATGADNVIPWQKGELGAIAK